MKDCSCFDTDKNKTVMNLTLVYEKHGATYDMVNIYVLTAGKSHFFSSWCRAVKLLVTSQWDQEYFKGVVLRFDKAASPQNASSWWHLCLLKMSCPEWEIISLDIYRVCNWPEIELRALIHPEWGAISWPLCVFSSCFITVGRTVSTLIISWLESVSEIS